MKKGQNPTQKKQFNIYKLLTILLLIVLIIVVGVLLRNWYVQNRAEKQYKDLALQTNRLQNASGDNAISVPSTAEGNTQVEDTQQNDFLSELGVEVPQKTLDWNALAAVNPDIYAWIYIPGTNIDYPVLQSAGEDDYYLHHNLDGSKGYPACIYTEKISSKQFTDFNTVVYGHNMHDNSMFATLHYFEDATFFANCPYIYVYRDSRVLVYEIFAAYKTDNLHILYSNDFTSESGRSNYLDKIYSNTDDGANLRRDVQATPESHILTLSTCVKGKKQNRFLVQAVLLNEDEL